jgi:drug/metabolite transporter (DMT)-like permease
MKSSLDRQTIALLLLSVAMGAIGQLLLKAATDQMGDLKLSLDILLKFATNLTFILSMAIYFFSAVLWLLALLKADLSFAYPFLSLTYIAVLVGGAVFFHETITVLRVVGCAVIIAGLIIIARGEEKLPPVPETVQ